MKTIPRNSRINRFDLLWNFFCFSMQWIDSFHEEKHFSKTIEYEFVEISLIQRNKKKARHDEQIYWILRFYHDTNIYGILILFRTKSAKMVKSDKKKDILFPRCFCQSGHLTASQRCLSKKWPFLANCTLLKWMWLVCCVVSQKLNGYRYISS